MFKYPIKTIRWWEHILLFFVPKKIGVDVTKDKAFYLVSKRMFGNIYILKYWEEKPETFKGVGFDKVYEFDD